MSRFSTKILVLLALVCVTRAASAQVCTEWQWANPQPQGNRLTGIASGGGQFVAVGSAGVVLASPDGQVWTRQASGTRNDLQAVIWTGEAFIAVGSAGTVLSSRDGASWSVRQVRSDSTLRRVAVAATAGSFGSATPAHLVAVGDGGSIFTSPDGDQWTPSASGTNSNLRSVLWSRSRFVAAGDAGTILVSSNGTSWARSSFVSIDGVTSVADNGQEFLATSTGFFDNT
ncbi:MAG TPA: hypothetical protein VEO37_07550, partial [Thermoanaerobaculia bacterium]|nr:hypothetical protein [Thermoanaerobaculia bacterium]